MLKRLTAALALTAAVLTSVGAQEPPPVMIGERVRITHSCHATNGGVRCRTTSGTMTALQAENLVLGPAEEPIIVPMSAVEKLEVSRGLRGRADAGGVAGGIVGAIVGGAMGFGACAADQCKGFNETDLTFLAVSAYAGLGALVGLGVGALIGSQVKSDLWEEVPFQPVGVSMTYRGDGRLALGTTIRF